MNCARPDWQTADGSVKLFLGDCRAILPTLEPVSVDCILTDPQYGISTPGGDFTRINGKGTRRFDFFSGDNDHAAVLGIVDDALRLAVAAASRKASVYVWCGHRQFGQVCALLESFEFQTRFVVWSKTCPCPAPPGSGWPAGAELCVYGYRSGRTWNPRPGDAPFSNVLRYDSYRNGMPGKVDHPTQKPLGMIQELVEYSTGIGDTVLDCFLGSGTTGVACVRTGRKFIGIEKCEAYFNIAVKRITEELNRFPLWEPGCERDARGRVMASRAEPLPLLWDGNERTELPDLPENLRLLES